MSMTKLMSDTSDFTPPRSWRCSNASSTAKEQYLKLPYPPRDPNDELKASGQRPYFYSVEQNPGTISHHLYGGEPLDSVAAGRPFRILVAGGGTGDGTTNYAQTFTNAGVDVEITHFDLSSASIDIARKRLDNRNLKHTTQFIEGDLLDKQLLSTLGQFDYIDATGVIHHFSNPAEPLSNLAALLTPRGGFYLMLYGELGRTGVYHFQDMYRTVDLALDAKTARKLVHALPSSNWLRRNELMMGGDIKNLGDAGIYDLLLHECDNSFRVKDIVQLAREAGLRIIDFLSMDQYMPSADILDIIGGKFSHWLQLASFGELANGNIYKHHVYLGHLPQGRQAGSYAVTATGAKVSPDSVFCYTQNFVGTFADFDDEIVMQALEAFEAGLTMDYSDPESNLHRGQSPLMVYLARFTNCHRRVKEVLPLIQSSKVTVADLVAAAQQYFNAQGTNMARNWFLLTGPMFKKVPLLQRGGLMRSIAWRGRGWKRFMRRPRKFELQTSQKYAEAAQKFQLMVFVDGSDKAAFDHAKTELTALARAMGDEILVLYVHCEDPSNHGVMDRFLVRDRGLPAVRLAVKGQPVRAFRPRKVEPKVEAAALERFMRQHIDARSEAEYPSVEVSMDQANRFNRKADL